MNLATSHNFRRPKLNTTGASFFSLFYTLMQTCFRAESMECCTLNRV